VDGSGAMKLKGDAILISARIVAAANALVGMVSPRAYRAPLSIDAALKILQTETDRRYDRKVVTALAHYVENQGGDKLLEHKAAA
jgi:HD-GYP domain-containing protein (c-di-GMP phosphodiesterase class II)